MKKFSLVLMILLVGLIIYNASHIDFSDSLTSESNQMIYLRLVANILVLLSLALSYRRYSKKAKDDAKY